MLNSAIICTGKPETLNFIAKNVIVEAISEKNMKDVKKRSMIQ